MTEPLFPTSYLPPIGYMALLARCGHAAIEFCETFPKQTHRNRAEILTSNGILRLSVPVVRTNGNHTLTRDITVSYAERWNIQAIESAYNATPYFLYLWDGLRDILMSHHDYLTDLNQATLRYLMKTLGIECRVEASDSFSQPGDSITDYRNSFSHKPSSSAVSMPPYYQLWSERHGFCPNLSIIDLIFNIGPSESRRYLSSICHLPPLS